MVRLLALLTIFIFLINCDEEDDKIIPSSNVSLGNCKLIEETTITSDSRFHTKDTITFSRIYNSNDQVEKIIRFDRIRNQKDSILYSYNNDLLTYGFYYNLLGNNMMDTVLEIQYDSMNRPIKVKTPFNSIQTIDYIDSVNIVLHNKNTPYNVRRDAQFNLLTFVEQRNNIQTGSNFNASRLLYDDKKNPYRFAPRFSFDIAYFLAKNNIMENVNYSDSLLFVGDSNRIADSRVLFIYNDYSYPVEIIHDDRPIIYSKTLLTYECN